MLHFHILLMLKDAQTLKCGLYVLSWQILVELQVVYCATTCPLFLLNAMLSELVLGWEVVVCEQAELSFLKQSLIKSVGFIFHISV